MRTIPARFPARFSAAAPALLLLCAALVSACGKRETAPPIRAGNAELGKRLVAQYQCGACHAIPGLAAATGSAGPPLQGFGRRSYIAGRIPNMPDQLAAWLQDPPAMKPGTLMPDLGVSPDEARHMTAYLYTLE